jgi:O-antigen/teichoic acid export membrane protein
MYGFWTLLGTLIGYYGIMDLGLSSAVTRYMAGAIGTGDHKESNRVFNVALLSFSALGILAMILSIALAGMADLIWKNPADAALFWKVVLILGLNMAVDFPVRAYIGSLNAKMRFDIIATLQICSILLRTTLIFLALSFGYKIIALAWITFLAAIPEKILLIYYTKRNLPSLQFNWKDWSRKRAKKLYSYSAMTFIAQMGDLLRFNVDFIVITAFVSLSAVTHYKIASIMVTYFIMVIAALMGVLIPIFTHLWETKNQERMKDTFFFTTRISICISSFVAFGLIAWGWAFIERWMGPEYLDAYPCLVVLVLSSMFDLWQYPSVCLLYGISRHKFYALFNSVEGVFNLFLSLLLVRHFGIWGVALGTFIPMTVVKLLVQPIYVCRVSSIQYAAYVRVMAKTVLMVCFSLIIPLLISVFISSPDYLILSALGLGSFCIYALPLWLLEFNSSERQIIKEAIFPGRFMKSTIT